jgi:hypothetical protein
MDTPKQERTLHVAVVDTHHQKLLLERREWFVASPTEVSKVTELRLPSQTIPENISPEKCANRLIQAQLNIPTSAFAGLSTVNNHYGYAVRPVSLSGIDNVSPGFELHTEGTLEQSRELIVNDTVYTFALEALARLRRGH